MASRDGLEDACHDWRLSGGMVTKLSGRNASTRARLATKGVRQQRGDSTSPAREDLPFNAYCILTGGCLAHC